MLDFATRMIDTWSRNEDEENAIRLATPSLGMFAGTKVASSIGWRPVEAVAVGDQVLTFDAGLQEVVAVERCTISADLPKALWPVLVPANVLGNRDEMILLSEQPVVLEDDCAEEILGDPFALVPAAALVGYRGIRRVAPTRMSDLVTLHFAEDQVVFANLGALFFCAAHKGRGLTRLLDATVQDTYAPLSMDMAENLVDFICLERAGTEAAV